MNGLNFFFLEENDLNPYISTQKKKKKKLYTIKKNLTIEKIRFIRMCIYINLVKIPFGSS